MNPSHGKKVFFVSFCLLIVIASLGTVISNDLVWDDEALLGPYTQQGESRPISEVLTSDFFSGSSYIGASPISFWRPLTSLLLDVSGRLFGSFLPGYHFLSLLAAGFAMLSLFFVLVRLSGVRGRPAVFFLCAAWVVHPVGADVIAMVANMADHLSLGFLFLCLLVSIQIANNGVKARLFLALFFFAVLACGAKELGVVSIFMPAAALLLTSKPINKEAVRRGLVAMAACATAVALYLLARHSVIGSLDVPAFHSPQEWFLLFPKVIGLFLAKTVVFDPSPTIILIGPGLDFYFVLGVGLLAAWAVAVAFSFKRGSRSAKVATVGLLFCFLTLGVSGLSMAPRDGVIEFPPRYLHVPLAGLLIAVFPLIERLAQSERRTLLSMTAATVLLASGLVTFTRLSDWRTGITLWRAEVSYSPQNIEGHIHLAWAYVKTKRLDAAASVIEEIEDFPKRTNSQEAQRLALEALVLSGRENHFDEAIDRLMKARKLTPNDPGLVIGIYKMQKAAGRKSAAKDFLEKALREPALAQPRTQRLLRDSLGERGE